MLSCYVTIQMYYVIMLCYYPNVLCFHVMLLHVSNFLSCCITICVSSVTINIIMLCFHFFMVILLSCYVTILVSSVIRVLCYVFMFLW